MSNLYQLVQQQFGANAQNYVDSVDIAQGKSLERLLEIVQPQSHWRVLDIATGGGHTALAFAPRVREIVATDLTPQMLSAAEAFIHSKGVANVTFRAADACALPFDAAEFDLVTCRLAPHHFPDCALFAREMARVLKPDGVAGMIDLIAPADPPAARHINAYEKLRDPSHNWVYSVGEWEAFFSAAGFQMTHIETYQKTMDFETDCDRMSVPPRTRQQLRVMLRHAPAAARAVLAPQFSGNMLVGQVKFMRYEVLVVGKRATG